MSLFPLTDADRAIYNHELADFLPDKIIDIHTHVWLKALSEGYAPKPDAVKRSVTWPSLVAKDDSVEDLIKTYQLMFPGKSVTPLMFANCSYAEILGACNDYVRDCADKTGFPALYYSRPEESAEEIEKAIVSRGFLGLKSYLDLAPEYIPEAEIRIFDFFPHHQLKKIDEMGLIIMLHIPRNGRLKDPVNLAQILEIKQLYPNIQLIIAHIGRAYCASDIGDAFEILSAAPDLMFDFCANTCETAMYELLKAVGPEHVLFGSDMPITRMRMRRIEENGTYINLIPPGLYGDPSQDAHLREVSEDEGHQLTFFMYEEIMAFKRAAQRLHLSQADIEKVFYGNGNKMLEDARAKLALWAEK